MIVFRVLAATAALLAAVPAQAADTCQLKQIASLDIVRGTDGSVLVPVTIKDQAEYLILQMGNAHSGLTQATVTALGLKQMPISRKLLVTYFEQAARSTATATDFSIGGVKGDIDTFVIPDLDRYDPRTAGVLGLDVLKNFDVELNLRAGKLNLFSQDHCPGKVVYWSHAPYAALPMAFLMLGNFEMPMVLDGQKITTSLDTLHRENRMAIGDAASLFGVTVTSPGVGPARQDGSRFVRRAYAFKTLSGDGVTVSNPEVDLIGEPDPAQTRCDGSANGVRGSRCYGMEDDLDLGLDTQSRLRLYFAFGEKVLYFTAADPPAKVPDVPNRK